jgi:hypothetical protein
MRIITFDDNCKMFILDALGKINDSEGFIIDKASKEKELDRHGQPIKFAEFAGVINYKGKPTFCSGDLPSLIEIVDALRD